MARETGVWLLPNVRMKPEIAALWAAKIASDVFMSRNIPCSITSWWRPNDDDSLHKYHAAIDIDANIPINEGMLVAIADIVQDRLGTKSGPYDVVYHDGHIHIEYDPTGTGIKPYTAEKEGPWQASKSSEKSSATEPTKPKKRSTGPAKATALPKAQEEPK